MKVLKWILRLIIAAFIAMAAFFVVVASYSLSSQNGSESSQTSETVTDFLGRQIDRVAEKVPAFGKAVDKAKDFLIEHSPYGDDWQLTVRKLAHFSIYFMIASLMYLIFSVLRVPVGWRWFVSIVLCFILACLDELHQGSVVGRTMSTVDIWIDTAGAFTASTIYLIFGGINRWLFKD